MLLGSIASGMRIHIFRFDAIFLPFINTIHTQTSAQNRTTTEQSTDSESGLIIFLIFVVLVAAIWWKLKQRGGRYRERRYFSESIKKQTLGYQNYKCAICKKSTGGVWDLITSTVIGPIIALIITKYGALIVI
jgi:hypothetical protein